MKNCSTFVAGLLTFFLLIAAMPVLAQQGAISIDHVTCFYHADSILIPGDVQVFLRYFNSTDRRVDVSNGFRVYSPDGAVWDSTTISEVDGGTFMSYFDMLFHLGVHSSFSERNDTVGVLGAGTTTSPTKRLPVGYNGTPIVIKLWTVPDNNNGKHICIDTAIYSPGGTWKWVSVDGPTEYTYNPTFSGLPGQSYTPSVGYCFTLYHLPCGTARELTGRQSVASELGCPCSACCVGTTGNVNETGIVDLGDLSALVAYLTGGGYVLPCEEEANINNAGVVDLSDLSALVSYLTGGGFLLPNCP